MYVCVRVCACVHVCHCHSVCARMRLPQVSFLFHFLTVLLINVRLTIELFEQLVNVSLHA